MKMGLEFRSERCVHGHAAPDLRARIAVGAAEMFGNSEEVLKYISDEGSTSMSGSATSPA
jgi:hypothetical protein